MTEKEASALVRQKKEVILKIWEEKVRTNIQAAADQSRRALRDSLPKFLEQLAKNLEGGSEELCEMRAEKTGQEHGEDRAIHADYSLEVVLREYHFLRQTLFEVLCLEISCTASVTRTILDTLDASIRAAGREFASQLEDKTKTFDSILSSHADFMYLFDRDGRFTYANPALLKFWKLEAKDVIGRNFFDLNYSEEMATRLQQEVEDALAGKVVRSETSYPDGKGGESYFEHIFVATYGRLGEVIGVSGTTRNITQTKKASCELESTLSRLESERDLRERFVSTLSHDLRTPLAAAKMSAQLLQRRLVDSEDLAKLARRINDSMDRADNMIRDLLDANRIRAGQGIVLNLSDVSINSLITEVLEDFGTLHGNRFTRKPSEDVIGCWDKEGIRRVLENLLGNAVKYGNSGTPIVVGVKDQGINVEISVHNEGNPISKADQDRVFAPFSRTDSAQEGGQKGWGLGLSLVRGIAEAHGGSVSIESSAQCGTTFYVTILKNAQSKS